MVASPACAASGSVPDGEQPSGLCSSLLGRDLPFGDLLGAQGAGGLIPSTSRMDLNLTASVLASASVFCG